MITNSLLKKLLPVAIISLMLGMFPLGVFARDHDRGRDWNRGSHEVTVFRGERYHYHEGRFYRPTLFGFSFNFVMPPIGVVVTYLPYGYRTIIVGRARYYEYDNVYYQPCPRGYIVVQEPVATNEYISPNVIYAPAPSTVLPAQAPSFERETVTINVPTTSGTSIAITLVRYPNGFVGPQGEFYSTLPTAEQLRARYGR